MLKQRQNRIKAACVRNSARINRHEMDVNKLRHLFVNDKHKLIYCEVPKVACTNWKRILLILTGKMATTNPLDLLPDRVHHDYAHRFLRTLNSYTSTEIQYRLRNYYKVIFVRNPLERMLSAYRNKFLSGDNTYFNQKYGTRIIRRYRVNATQDALRHGNGVTFNEFITYLLDSRSGPFNSHWEAYYKLCLPCLVQYDYIGKYETLGEDGNRVLRNLNVHRWLRFPVSNKKGTKTADELKAFFANTSLERIHKLWQLYSVDYDMFGYDYPDKFNDS